MKDLKKLEDNYWRFANEQVYGDPNSALAYAFDAGVLYAVRTETTGDEATGLDDPYEEEEEA